MKKDKDIDYYDVIIEQEKKSHELANQTDRETKTLTQKRLKEVLRYNPDTGVFRWNEDRGIGMYKDRIAGCCDSDYIRITIDYKMYFAHRLVFLYMGGYFPENQIDHINRDPSDNRWCNLREVSNQCNSRNRTLAKNNKSGVTGVCYVKERSNWRSYIKVDGKLINLSTNKKFIEAVRARWIAERKYGFQNCNTTSCAYLYLKKHREDHMDSPEERRVNMIKRTLKLREGE